MLRPPPPQLLKRVIFVSEVVSPLSSAPLSLWSFKSAFPKFWAGTQKRVPRYAAWCQRMFEIWTSFKSDRNLEISKKLGWFCQGTPTRQFFKQKALPAWSENVDNPYYVANIKYTGQNLFNAESLFALSYPITSCFQNCSSKSIYPRHSWTPPPLSLASCLRTYRYKVQRIHSAQDLVDGCITKEMKYKYTFL